MANKCGHCRVKEEQLALAEGLLLRYRSRSRHCIAAIAVLLCSLLYALIARPEHSFHLYALLAFTLGCILASLLINIKDL